MSIKKLFNSTNKVRNYLSDTDDKSAFKDAESGRNVEAIKEKQEAYVPQIDYLKAENFARYGSAYLYYKSAIERVHDYYPYDGSEAEITEFYNGLLDIEKFIFNNLYPRTTGYAILSVDGWGALGGATPPSSGGYGVPATQEYITLYGGPNTSSYNKLADAFSNPNDSKHQHSNIYDTSIYQTEGYPTNYASGSRTSNLKSDFDTGVTIEFWLKTGSIASSLTEKQVIFDMWNNAATSSVDYGRITIELSGGIPHDVPGGTKSPFILTVQSGASATGAYGIYTSSIGETTIDASDLSDWGHYAFVLRNTGSTFLTKLYVNGVLKDTNTNSASPPLGALNPKNMMGRIGSLLTAPSGVLQAGLGHLTAISAAPSDFSGAGKLSGSIDEFRFWKEARNSREIARHYLSQVRGGTNTDISNANLGVYYKFNEGITLTSSTDSTVLDYSGRISNGVWTGYGSNSRNTGSAIVSASAAKIEYRDPIIYSYHNDVQNLKGDLLTSGSVHDSNNNNMFLSLIPSWIIEEDDNQTADIRKISHIAGAYFDKLYLQISEITKFKDTTYTSASYKPNSFAKHLPQSLGLYMPELFIDSDVTEKFLNRDQNTLFESDLNDTKNLIYLNIYNNLSNIYKAKGTEKSIRNILRCFNLDDRLVKLNVYSDGQTFPLRNNLQQTLINKTFINFNNNLSGVIYQAQSASNPETRDYITGTVADGKEKKYGFTLEADVLFPYYTSNDTVNRYFLTSSLFGVYQADTTASTDTTFLPTDRVNFQVHAVKPTRESKNTYFRLSSSLTPFPMPLLTSSMFMDVYNDSKWNLSVRIKPSKYPVADIVSGASGYTYDVTFSGINTYLGSIQNSFSISSSVGAAVGNFLSTEAKRIYVGAEKTNITGALLQKSDVLFSGIRFWTRYLEDSDLKHHANDIDNAGISGSYRNISPLDSNNDGYELLNLNTLALNWNFNNVTASDSGGNFFVQDISSGSALLRNEYGWLGDVVGYQHTGLADSFKPSSSGSVNNKLINSFKFADPEIATAGDMVNILSSDDQVFGLPLSQTVPNFFYVLEKSMYAAISEEMLAFFAGAVDFNNLIGEPVNRYRERYKDLEKVREIFFRKVTTVSDVEKYITYYKWFDDALSQIIAQLVPASSGFVPDVYDTIESHVLERHKYRSQFPTIEYKSATEGVILGINEATYNWRLNHHPVSDLERENSEWWRQRADPAKATRISSGDSDIDSERNTTRESIANENNKTASYYSTTGRTTYKASTYVRRSLASPYKLESQKNRTYKGGVNFTDNKNIHFTYDALYPYGPVFVDGTDRFPENVLVFFVQDIINSKDTTDVTAPVELNKTKRVFKVNHGRDWEDGRGYSNVKSSYVFPFNIMSSSVSGGFNRSVIARVTGSIEITNLHNDVYGPDMEVPMQGPFPYYAVGGHQSRHIALNTGSDDYTNRPEGWKLLLGAVTGSTPDVTGALGMVGADYPWPDATDYPPSSSQKAVLYRDFIAKRPVNIRNIKSTTGSVLGNYTKNWEIVNTVGGFSNPRNFVKNQPTLPDTITETPSASQGRSILDIHRSDEGHYEFVPDYSLSYLTGTNNKSVIIGRFSAPGGIEVSGRGYQDIRAAEMSVYNAIPYRNLTVIKPSQGPSGSISEGTGSGTSGIRVSDIHTKDYGLISHLARHTGRFGRDSIFVTGPGTTYEELPGFHKVHRNTKVGLKITSTGTIFSPTTITVATSSKFDNFFVQYQIPRSDRQYAWITNSLAVDSDDVRFHGYAPVFGPQAGVYSSSAEGHVAYFNFVSASNVLGTTVTTLYQPSNRLNIFAIDAVDEVVGAPNTLGSDLNSASSDYINTNLLTKTGIINEITKDVNYFNLLMTNRGSNFGWSWNSARLGQHPILEKHRKNNKLTVYNESKNKFDSYRVSPVSTRGRPIYVNFDLADQNVTLQATHNNEFIYFNETSLNDLLYSTTKRNNTVFDQVNQLMNGAGSYDYNLNWVLYSENVFPSLRNEYLSRSLDKTGYDNKFWRDSATDRVIAGTASANSFGIAISQSCWPLDAQEDFTTRTQPVTIDTAGAFLELISEGKAGELQNNYILVHTGNGANAVTSVKSIRPGGLYSRKHMLSSPQSIVSPSGVKVVQTGSLTSIFVHTIQSYAGEAKWEADSQAGIVVKSGSRSIFEASASAPWFNGYDDFKADLKLMAKDYSIIPEFRISEHVEDYIKYGVNNKTKFDTFEIPGTDINSSTASFYKDYSNSEFMTNFLQIKDGTLLDAKEIKLVCSAAIRFNPYKGFYPAQRTLDIVKQFSSSYASSLVATHAGTIAQNADGHLRPIIQALFAPGLLYNSIKSGLAVDYPIVTDQTKLRKAHYGNTTDTDNWMISTQNTASSFSSEGYNGGQFWDFRVPFEAIIAPEKYLDGLDLFDMEPHPSAALNVTASWSNQSNDPIYSLMTENFLGEVANFFLKNNSFTKLESETVTKDLEFQEGSVYGARLKIRRSCTGPRTYEHESGSGGNNSAFTKFGGRLYQSGAFSTGSFPLPQDPRQNVSFKENFTMYSRPSAFGPPAAGRPSGSFAAKTGVTASVAMDGLSGFNWAYTPPYYNGESWIDFIFEPKAFTQYDLEAILAETKTVCWRADPGVSASLGIEISGTQLVRSFSGSVEFPSVGALIYEGNNINDNAMQLSASVNYLGIKRVQKQQKDKFGNQTSTENETAGKKWVIEPKFETPILNFNDEGVHPITNANSTLTIPTYGSASVPRGMWHQFGVIPETADKGIFMEIGEIPRSWLKNHYDVIFKDSVYNSENVAKNGLDRYQKIKPLTDVIKFKSTNSKARLGELADKRTIKEAVIAVPYVVDSVNNTDLPTLSGTIAQERKRFFNIPKQRIDAASKESIGSLAGDSLNTAGESIRKLLQKMENYVLPPQFDFLNNKNIEPVVMYVFEFEYTFDKDDLSYMWQNLAPRDYKKITLTSESVAHNLADTELLTAANILDNKNLRWMVFKVKQRSQTKYSDLVTPQVGQSSNGEMFDINEEQSAEYTPSFNWPYDYLSFIELVKIDAEVLYKKDESEDEVE